MMRLERAQGRSDRWRLWPLFAIILSLAACYESEREIIPVELGDVVPFEGHLIVWAGDEESTNFGRGADGNDYRYENHREYEVSTGVLRAMRLQDNIFAVQLRPDDADYYQLLFYRITSDAAVRVEAASAREVEELAARSGVALKDTGMGYAKLSGEPAGMLAFVRGHAGMRFRDWQKRPR